MKPRQRFPTKAAARQAVWDLLEKKGLARFPFPPHRRIPNFDGAQQAAQRLFTLSPWKDAKRLKINPDAPQRPVRTEALRRGIRVYVPTPRLRGGFLLLDPAAIPPEKIHEAAGLSTGRRWARPIPLTQLPQMDAIVCGSVGVTRRGYRLGKGEGYSDLEFGILLELGHRAIPVATTVHDVQVIESFPQDSTDLPLSAIVTPTRTIRIRRRSPVSGIDWTKLNEKDLDKMPILRKLRQLLRKHG